MIALYQPVGALMMDHDTGHCCMLWFLHPRLKAGRKLKVEGPPYCVLRGQGKGIQRPPNYLHAEKLVSKAISHRQSSFL